MPKKNAPSGNSYKGGASGRRNVAKTQMPLCRFGPACTRSDCIYRHPKKSALPTKRAEGPVCVPFLQGKCVYGSSCYRSHPDAKTVESILSSYRLKPCRFGRTCQTQDCLFQHPAKTAEETFEATVDAEMTNDPSRPLSAFSSAFVPGRGLATTISGGGGAVSSASAPALARYQAVETLPEHSNVLKLPKTNDLQQREAEKALQVAEDTSYATWLQTQLKALPVAQMSVDQYIQSWKRADPATAFAMRDPFRKLCFVNDPAEDTLGRGVVDLHYQTLEGVIPVLDVLFYPELTGGAPIQGLVPALRDERDECCGRGVWLITGVGNHAVQGAYMQMTLEGAVYTYLTDRGMRFRHGTLGTGKRGGSFWVTL